MTDVRRDLSLLILLVVAAALGFGLEAATESARSARPPAIGGDRFVERAVYCPPPQLSDARSKVAVSVDSEGETLIGVGATDERVQLDAGHRVEVVAAQGPLLISGYGENPIASAAQIVGGDDPGAAAGECASRASMRWYFAEGSSALGFDERFFVHNPFPRDALVRVLLYTPKGELARANLAEIVVPAGKTEIVRINDFVRQNRFLGAAVLATRGRVVAWRAMTVESEDRPHGMVMTLGAPALSDVWYLPEGAIGAGIEERVSLLNPTDEEAVATVTLATSEGSIQPPRLVEIPVPPQTLMPLALADKVTGRDRELGGTSVVVRTSAGVLVAERTVFYETSDLDGVTSEIGATELARRWVIGPPVIEPVTDAIVLVNPGADAAIVEIVLQRREGEAVGPGELRSISVPPSGRVKIPIGNWTRGKPLVAYVSSDSPIVAERVASSSADVAALLGVPLLD